MKRTMERSNGIDRKRAKIVGALFILGTVAGALSAIFTGSILEPVMNFWRW